MSGTDCSILELGSSEFFEFLARRPADENTLPVSGSFELTLRCNLRCRHCYIHFPGAAEGELDTDDVRRVLDILVGAGVLGLLLTGGEIFRRRDFRPIYEHAKRRGLLITLFTNATLVDDSLADLLAALPPRMIEVSVYGYTAPTYERVTGVPGSFAAFRRGLERLLARGLPVRLKAMVLRSNVHEFPAIRTWASSLGVPFRYDPIVNAALDGGPGPFAERLDPAAVAQLQTRPANESAQDERSSVTRDLRLFRCGAGRLTFHVDPRGMLHPCMMWRRDPYDLLNGSIAGWSRHLQNLLARQIPPDSECADCPDRRRCSLCAATSAAEAALPGYPVAYYCSICRARPDRVSQGATDHAALS